MKTENLKQFIIRNRYAYREESITEFFSEDLFALCVMFNTNEDRILFKNGEKIYTYNKDMSNERKIDVILEILDDIKYPTYQKKGGEMDRLMTELGFI